MKTIILVKLLNEDASAYHASSYEQALKDVINTAEWMANSTYSGEPDKPHVNVDSKKIKKEFDFLWKEKIGFSTLQHVYCFK